MVEITFNKENLLLVNIDDVVGNDWNPKDENTPEYYKVMDSIKTLGFNEAIQVREYEGKYQVLDGMQRYTIAKELGMTLIPIYNNGVVSDQRAREHTIWKQVQVPFSRVDEAFLVKQILEMGEPIALPYSDIELEEMKALTEFNMEEYGTEYELTNEGSKDEVIKLKVPNERLEEFVKNLEKEYVTEDDANVQVASVKKIKLTKSQIEIIERAIKSVEDGDLGYKNAGKALELICGDFLASR